MRPGRWAKGDQSVWYSQSPLFSRRTSRGVFPGAAIAQPASSVYRSARLLSVRAASATPTRYQDYAWSCSRSSSTVPGQSTLHQPLALRAPTLRSRRPRDGRIGAVRTDTGRFWILSSCIAAMRSSTPTASARSFLLASCGIRGARQRESQRHTLCLQTTGGGKRDRSGGRYQADKQEMTLTTRSGTPASEGTARSAASSEAAVGRLGFCFGVRGLSRCMPRGAESTRSRRGEWGHEG